MEKPTLLYVSPFWPQKSGISEYSEALIYGLDKYFEIALVIDDYKLENKAIREKFDVIKYNSDKDFSSYDYIIYNFGNNPEFHSYMYEMIQKYSGYVILHDYVLYYLTVGYYEERNMLFQKIYEIEGIKGIQLAKESLKNIESRNLLDHKRIASMLPMNREVIEKAKGIFVHSEYSRNIIAENYKYIEINKINLVKCETMNLRDDKFLNQYFSLDDNAYVIGSIGFIAETKQNELICLSVKKYNETHEDKIYYVMIGEGNCVNHLLDKYIHKTGFLSNNEFFHAINSCNLIMNLRYPYNGESSATLIQCMDMKKPCVVTNIGWFKEIPDDCVIKLSVNVSVDELCNRIDRIKDEDLSGIVNNAKNYVVNQCMPDKVAKSIIEVISKYN